METEYIRKQDIWQVMTNAWRNHSQIAIGQDRPNVRHTFPTILHTDSYPSGATPAVKEHLAQAVRRAVRRNAGWYTPLESFIKDLSEVMARRQGLVPGAGYICHRTSQRYGACAVRH